MTAYTEYPTLRRRLLYGLSPPSALCAALLYLWLPGCSPTAEPAPEATLTAKVLKVIDGDTVALESGDKVRYIGIDAPEAGECFADEACQFNRSLVEGKEVRLELDEQLIDPYGRLLAYVYVDTLFVNAALVRDGFARAEAYPPDIKYAQSFEMLEGHARRNGRGLWGACESGNR